MHAPGIRNRIKSRIMDTNEAYAEDRVLKKKLKVRYFGNFVE